MSGTPSVPPCLIAGMKLVPGMEARRWDWIGGEVESVCR